MDRLLKEFVLVLFSFFVVAGFGYASIRKVFEDTLGDWVLSKKWLIGGPQLDGSRVESMIA